MAKPKPFEVEIELVLGPFRWSEVRNARGHYVLRMVAGLESITCLDCGRTSHHPTDVSERYCANCHKFHEAL